MAAAHNGPQAAGCRASCRTFKSPYRRARKPGAGLTYAGAARAFKEMGLRGKIPLPRDPLRRAPRSASPARGRQGGAGGERQGRARDRIRGRGPRAGAQERACDGVVQGRAAGPRAERGARPPGPVRSRGEGSLPPGRAAPATQSAASRAARGRAGCSARLHDRRRGGPPRAGMPRRAQAETPAARGGRVPSRTRPATALPSRRCAPSSPRSPTSRSTAPAPCAAGSGGASRRARSSRRRSKSAPAPARRGSPPAGRAPSKGG